MDILANTSSAVFDRMTIFGCSLKKWSQVPCWFNKNKKKYISMFYLNIFKGVCIS